MKKKFWVKIFSLACAVCASFGIFSVQNVAKTEAETNNAAQVIDMYLIAGQSNAAGYSFHENQLSEEFTNVWYAGETDKNRETGKATSSNIDSFEDFYKKVEAGYGTDSKRFGPEYGIAKVLNEHYTQENPAFIFKTAAGSTSLQNSSTIAPQHGNWYPRSLWADGFTPNSNSCTGYQYQLFIDNFTHVYNELVENGYQPVVKGMFWMQGCADVSYPNIYEPILRTLISDMRADLQSITGDENLEYMPFVIGKIATSIEMYDNPAVPVFNVMQQKVADDTPAVRTVESADLTIVNPDGSYKYDRWHFLCQDMVTFGERAGNRLWELTNSDGISAVARGNGQISYTKSGSNITVTLTPDPYQNLKSLTINGQDVTNDVVDNVYIFEQTTEYVNIIAEFSAGLDAWDAYEEECVMDIVEYFSRTDLITDEGVTYAPFETCISVGGLSKILAQSCGISFATQFKSDCWMGDATQWFSVYLGASNVEFTLTSNGDLKISLYNHTKDIENALFYSVLIPNFDCMQKHEFRIARVNTLDTGDSAYAIRVYLDEKLVLFEYDTDSVWDSSAWNTLKVFNMTESAVVLRSALKEKIQFEEEQNVVDITELNGNAALFESAGLAVKSSSLGVSGAREEHIPDSLAINMGSLAGFNKVSNGVKWKMKAESKWTKDNDIIRLQLGATQIHIAYNTTSGTIASNTHTNWSHGLKHISTMRQSGLVLMENYDPTEWHEWKIVRVAATNASGYSVRFYIDGQLCLDLYTSGELIDITTQADGSLKYGKTYNYVMLVNGTGQTMRFKTTFYSRPIVEEEVCEDIISYGASTELLNSEGEIYGHGLSPIDSASGSSSAFGNEWYAKSNGIEFMFKATEDWGTGYDKLKILLGATQIRFNVTKENKLTLHVYNTANKYVAFWGNSEIPLNIELDETVWHTIKITRQKFLYTSGSYGERGLQVNVYVDGELLYQSVEMSGGMWSFANRKISVTNLSGVDVLFKSTLEASTFDEQYVFEEEKIAELYDMPQDNQMLYYEDAFTGLEINNIDRIINSVYTEEFSSSTSGTQFVLTSQDAWKTSGTEKKLVALTAAELKTLTVLGNKEMFKLNGTGEWTEVATIGVTSGTKYKVQYVDWTSDWKRTTTSDGVRLVGETDLGCWGFPNHYSSNNGTLYYSSDTTGMKFSAETDFASRYHIHMDYGTHTIQIKLTPEQKLVVRVYSRYSWVVLFEGYVCDENGEPIEFKTGTYTGNEPYNYYGQILNNGDLYQNIFKISKVQETSNNGFMTRLWINGHLAFEVYDSNVMGGEGKWSHFLIDNISGTVIKAYSITSFEEFKENILKEFDAFRETD